MGFKTPVLINSATDTNQSKTSSPVDCNKELLSPDSLIMTAPNPYQVLGIPPGSPPFVIEEAYRAAARKYHPDNGGTQQQFSQVVAAYRSLKESGLTAENSPKVSPGVAQNPNQSQGRNVLHSHKLTSIYRVAPRVHGLADTTKTSIVFMRLAFIAVGMSLSLLGALITSVFSPSIINIVTASLVGITAGIFTPQLLLAIYSKKTRPFVLMTAIGALLSFSFYGLPIVGGGVALCVMLSPFKKATVGA